MGKLKILDWKISKWSNNNYTIEIVWPWYYLWQTIRFIANHTNTWASTLSISNKTVMNITKIDWTALVWWEIQEWRAITLSLNELWTFDIVSDTTSVWWNIPTDISELTDNEWLLNWWYTRISRTFTPAELWTMSTPIEVLPNLGSNFYYHIRQFILEMNCTIPYTWWVALWIFWWTMMNPYISATWDNILISGPHIINLLPVSFYTEDGMSTPTDALNWDSDIKVTIEYTIFKK